MNEKPNLSIDEVNSINKLKKNPNIIIKPYDKGSGIVVLDKEKYIKEAERQLNNPLYYKKLKEPIYHNNVTKIHSVLKDLLNKKYISQDQLKYLSGPEDYRQRIFYLLPKVHKPRDRWPDPQCPEGRPIVSDVNSETYRVSELIDYYLNPLSIKHSSYIRNSFEFVKQIQNKIINKDYLLVTGDVSSLYTNMNIDRMLNVVNKAFVDNPDFSRPDKEILDLLDISLKFNDFSFNGDVYQQILGCSMGKRWAPSLANLYLIEFDEKARNGFPIKPLFFVRYLDDIFFIFPSSDLAALKDYENYLNTLIPNIKITLEYSTDEIPFLDCIVYRKDNILQTRTFFKQTDTHQLLHTTSFHPRHVVPGLVKSQLIRFKRLSSTKIDYDHTCKTLFNVLKNRGYKQKLLRKLQYEIWYKYIDKLSTNVAQNSNEGKDRLLPIIVDYNKIGTDLSTQYKTILNENDFTKSCKLITAYKIGKNLKNLLVSSSLENDKQQGFRGCDRPRCSTCKIHSQATSSFCSTTNKNKYYIKDNIYCNTTNLVYLITCRSCKKQYVGETGRALRDRLNDHVSAIKNKSKTPIAVHFNSESHSILDLSITPIEIIKNVIDSTQCRLNRERQWQNKLNTRYPVGINNAPCEY